LVDAIRLIGAIKKVSAIYRTVEFRNTCCGSGGGSTQQQLRPQHPQLLR
jgi:hypothetical protein